MKKNIRLALAQINCIVGDLEGNEAKILHYITEAKGKEADIIVFPEMAVTGYPPEDLLHKPKFIEDNIATLLRIAGKCGDIIAIIGFANREGALFPEFCTERKNRSLYNSAAIISGGKVRKVYNKIILPNYGVFDEKRYFTEGDCCNVFHFNNIVFGVNICEDIWHSNGPTNVQASYGDAELIININASPFHAGKHSLREKVVAKRAIESGVTIVYVNMVGGQDELVFDGGSMVINNNGEVVTGTVHFKETLLVVDVEIEDKNVTKSSSVGNVIYVGMKEVHYELCQLDKRLKHKKNMFISSPSPSLDPLEEIYEALILGTGDYVKKSGFKKVIIGLSGGIDSALTAAIAVDALGAENVMGIALPSRYSSTGSVDDASSLAESLDIHFDVISIEEGFKSFLNMLDPLFEEYEPDVTEENLQARIRCNILMALSNKYGRMLLTTGNKSELSVGYTTLYGDMAGGFCVLKDVPKTLVLKLSNYVNKAAGLERIPFNTITKPPSAELRPDQTDQDSLPPYDILDNILQMYIEDELSFSEIVEEGFEEAIVEKVIQMVDQNEYKRRQAAPGVKITPKAFGRDRRMPLVNLYKSTSHS